MEAFEHRGEALKWKTVFHYQDRQTPVIVDIFKCFKWAPLAVYVGGTASQRMAALNVTESSVGQTACRPGHS